MGQIPKNIPDGWRLMEYGEKLFPGKFKLQWKTSTNGKWHVGDDSWNGEEFRATRTFYAIVRGGSKVPAKPKDAKAVWTHKSVIVPAKATKADLVKLLQETMDQLNETGTKLVAAQNTITRLKKKVSK